MSPTATPETETERTPEQQELPCTPARSKLGRVAMEYIKYKEELESKEPGLIKRKEAVEKAMEEEGKQSILVASPDTSEKYRFTLKQGITKLSVTREKEGFSKGK